MELAINVTIVGLTVVFLVLILLTFIISILGKLLNNNASKDNSETNEDLSDYKLVEEDNEYETESEVTSVNTDNQLIAVLTAAIAVTIGDSNTSNFRVVSFRRLPQPDSLWNTTARNEQIGLK